MKQSLLSIPDRSPRCMSAKDMPDSLCHRLIEELLAGNFRLTDWQLGFLVNVRGKKTYTLQQREVVYKAAFAFHIL